MKICNKCGAVNSYDSYNCRSCGCNSFRHKCDNCGAEYDGGAYCPHCGVKVGQPARVCPTCKTVYYTNSCPTCGYIYTPQNAPSQNIGYYRPAQQPYRDYGTNRTLWILGWIFMFPIPLTILIIRSNKLSKAAKIAIISIMVITIMLIGLFFGEHEDGTRLIDSVTNQQSYSSTEYTE